MGRHGTAQTGRKVGGDVWLEFPTANKGGYKTCQVRLGKTLMCLSVGDDDKTKQSAQT